MLHPSRFAGLSILCATLLGSGASFAQGPTLTGDATRPLQVRPTLTATAGVSLAPGEHTMSLHHLRPGVRAQYGHWTGRLSLELARAELDLLDAYSERRVDDWLTLRAGVFKVPFTLEREESLKQRTGTDWPLFTRALGGERQWGAALYAHPSHLRMQLGVFSGQATRSGHADWLCREILDDRPAIAALADPRGVHPEVVGMIGVDSFTGLANLHHGHHLGELDLSAVVSFALDSAPRHPGEAWGRVAPEFRLSADHFALLVGAGLSAASPDAPLLGAAHVELDFLANEDLTLYTEGSVIGTAHLDGKADPRAAGEAGIGASAFFFAHHLRLQVQSQVEHGPHDVGFALHPALFAQISAYL